MKTVCFVAVSVSLVASASAQTYEGFDCTEDCSGHRAGYEWAAENYITDETECGGNSYSFDEGCAAYVANPYRDDSTVDDEGNVIPDE